MQQPLPHSWHEILKDGRSSTAILFSEGQNWHQLDWHEYYDSVQSVARALSGIGADQGDRIAIMANTRFEWACIDHAAMALGLIIIPLYPQISDEDFGFIIEDSRPHYLFIENRSLLKQWYGLNKKFSQTPKIICLEKVRHDDLEALYWPEFLAQGSNEQLSLAERGLLVKADDPMTIIYTSGTSGLPKGVPLTHKQAISALEAFQLLDVRSQDRSLSVLPYAHILGRIEHWGHLAKGFTLAFSRGFEHLVDDFAQIQPTIFVAVPRVFEKIYQRIQTRVSGGSKPVKVAFEWGQQQARQWSHLRSQQIRPSLKLQITKILVDKILLEKVRRTFGGKLRFAVCGGARLDPEMAEFFHSSGVLLLEGYGLTETTGAICVNRPYDFRFGTVGKPIGDVQIMIDPEGEILVKSDKVFSGYHSPNGPDTSCFSDGWFRTGDMGEVLSSGELRITDRKKSLFKTVGGKYIVPARLEQKIKKNPLVSQVYIHGENQKYVVALLTLNPDQLKSFAVQNDLSYSDFSSLTQSPKVLGELRNWIAQVNSELASHESIKNFAVLEKEFSVSEGEMTASLKLKEKKIRDRYKELLSSLYS